MRCSDSDCEWCQNVFGIEANPEAEVEEGNNQANSEVEEESIPDQEETVSH
jgi:hypothetical protein